MDRDTSIASTTVASCADADLRVDAGSTISATGATQQVASGIVRGLVAGNEFRISAGVERCGLGLAPALRRRRG
jgi:hypothetical protein